jgi:uncharacterized membrane protein (UPF0127 family)
MKSDEHRPTAATIPDDRQRPGSAAVTPTHYRLELDPDVQAGYFECRAWITLSLSAPTSRITLCADALQIFRVTLGGRPCAWESEDGGLSVVPDVPLQAGEVVVQIDCRGALSDAPCGFYRGNGYLATGLQPAYAPRLFPCVDDIGIKTPFELSVLVDVGQAAVSNARALDTRDESGRCRVTFAASPAMPTQMLALAVGAFETLSTRVGRVPLCLHSLGGLQRFSFAFECAGRALAFFVDWLAQPFPFDKLDLVALPQAGVAGLENTAAIFLREDSIVVDEASSVERRREVALLVAHEVAHQWLGCLVTPAGWDALWLSEGFATWLAPKALAAFAPALSDPLADVESMRVALQSDMSAGARPLGAAVDRSQSLIALFDVTSYQKGAALLRMLEHWLGETTFQRGVQLYVARHAHATAVACGLWEALGHVSGVDVAGVAGSFVRSPGVVRIWIAFAGPTISVSRVAGPLLDLPLQLSIGLEDGTREHRAVLLDGAHASSTLPIAVQWVCANANASGYYQCLYEVWPSPAALPEAEALALIHDAWLALWGGDIDLLHYFDIAEQALDCGCAQDLLALQFDELRELLASGARRVLFDRWVLGRAGSAIDSRRLRAEAGDTNLLQRMRRAIGGWIDTGVLQPDGPVALLDTVARFGDEALFDRLALMLDSGDCPPGLDRDRLISALAAFQLPTRLPQQMALLEHPALDAGERLLTSERLLGNPVARLAVWGWIKSQWMTGGHAPLVGIGGRGPLAALGAFADDAVGRDIAAFISTKDASDARCLLQASLDQINGRIAFREKHQRSMDAWLARSTASPAVRDDRLWNEAALLNLMHAAFAGALYQRMLFERAGLPLPPWMHTAENLRGALGMVGQQWMRNLHDQPLMSDATLALAQRLAEDLEAAAAHAAAHVAMLPSASDGRVHRVVCVALGRVGVMTEQALDGELCLARLRGDHAGARWLHSRLGGLRPALQRARDALARLPEAAQSRQQRIALQNDAARMAGELRLVGVRLTGALARLGWAQAPTPDAEWRASGFSVSDIRRWRAAGFDQAENAAEWATRRFDPKQAQALASSGADPHALRMSAGTASQARSIITLPDGTPFHVEVANDPVSRTAGLRHRDSLAEDHGMLFVHAEDERRPVSMHGVRFPLDVAWLDADGCVLHVERELQPWTSHPVPSTWGRSWCRHLLELPAGSLARHGVAVGSQLGMGHPPRRPSLD